MTNSITLHCEPESGVYEYEVRFKPEVDNMKFRPKYLNQHKEVLGDARTFDGTLLYMPKLLPDTITKLISKSAVDETEVELTVIYKRKKQLGECIQLYNILFERIFRILKYLRVGRKNFDPNAPVLINAHKLEVWPGYVKSVEELEGGLMLTLDVSHRVLSKRTVHEMMIEILKEDKAKFQDNFKKAMIGELAQKY